MKSIQQKDVGSNMVYLFPFVFVSLWSPAPQAYDSIIKLDTITFSELTNHNHATISHLMLSLAKFFKDIINSDLFLP
jgi:hypothetical protein